MTINSQSTIRSRELGEAIRIVMESADLKGKRIAELVGWSESKVSRILTGHAPPSEVELSALLALCGVVGDQRECLLDLCREQAFLNRSTGRDLLIAHQGKALRVTEFHNSLIPSLLQTESYASSIAHRIANRDDGEVDVYLKLQHQAKRMFERTASRPPSYTIIVHEQALRLPVGGAEVMLEQLHHMLRMGVRSYVSICVIPTDLGAFPGIGGPFCFMEFSEFNPIVYVEDEMDGYFLEGFDTVTRYRALIAALSAVSAKGNESANVIRDIATQYRR
jgi:transcriptional regulator with XRE-family HTH domain